MSIAPLMCKKCNLECQFDRFGLFPEKDNLKTYAVSWICPKCKDITLDLCPIGPLVPLPNSCLNCGEPGEPDDEDYLCANCSMTRGETLQLFGPFPPLGKFASTSRELFSQGIIRRSIAIVNHALQEDITLESAWRLKYQFMDLLGRPELKEQMLVTALTNSVPAFLIISYGCLLYDMGRYQESIVAYDRYLALSIDDLKGSVLGNKANSLLAIERFDEAEKNYLAAIEIEPHNHINYINYLNLLLAQEKWDTALKIVEQSLKLILPADYLSQLLEFKSLIYAELDRGKEALDAIDEALKHNQQSIKGHYLRGRALGLIGKLADAEAEMKWVLSMDKDNIDALRAIKMLAEVQTKNKRSFWQRLWQ